MPVLTLLDRALILAQHELDAMRNGDVDAAEEHFNERESLMMEAARVVDEDDPDDYYVKLIAIQGYNQLIRDEGAELLEQIRAQVVDLRQTNKAARGYARTMLS